MSLTRIGSIGINTGIAFAGVTTIVTLNTANDALSIGATVNVGSGITLGASGDIFATGVSTFSGNLKVGSGVTISPDGDVFFTGIATGNGSGLTALNATNIASGTVPTARLGSGTASSSTFLRGDSSFQTVDTDLVSDTSPQLGGNLDVNTKNILFGDSSDGSSDDVLIFGAGSDFKIYHNGHNIINGATGQNLEIQTNAFRVRNQADSESMIVANADDSVELYHNNSKKLETTSGGVSITGNCNVDGNITLSDNEEIQFGNSTDFRIYHDSNNTYLRDVGTGSLSISGSQVSFDSSNLAEFMIRAIENGAVELYYDGTKKFETAADGVNLAGNNLIFQGQSNRMIKYRSGDNDMIYEFDAGDFYRQDIGNNRHEFFIGNSKVTSVTGDGITFGSDTAAANALDDYEEGTYNATMTVTSGSLSVTNNLLSYVKIGTTCHVTGRLYPSLSSSGSMGSFTFSLPFAAKGSNTGQVQYEQGILLHVFRATEDTDGTDGANRSIRNFRIIASTSEAKMISVNNGGYGTFGTTAPHMMATFTYQTNT